ncbi:hypothetical protein HAHE_22710 [Haloferula helveola]|uniref:Autotransporter-associated beta strand repeat-containing protein n=1 Tax=Haloferula helveola TaxID=490095 RepID=A0ABM7REE0_9BACT|nr:hypothetical protein HAHE_22710 [Haloferula helveola]
MKSSFPPLRATAGISRSVVIVATGTLLASAPHAAAEAFWKFWPNYSSPSGNFNNPGNWTSGLPVQVDTVNIVSVGTGYLGGNVNIYYAPIANVDTFAEMDLRPYLNNTINFFYQWPGEDLTINHWLKVLEGTTFRHTNGRLTVGDLEVRDGASYQVYLNSTPELFFGQAEISENSSMTISNGSVSATTAGHTLELQATGGVPMLQQTGGSLSLGRILLNYEQGATFSLTGGTLTLDDTLGAGMLKIGTTDNEPGTPAASTGTASFTLGGNAVLGGDDVEVTIGENDRPGSMAQSGTSSADLRRLFIGLNSDGTASMSGGTLDIDTMLAVGGDGLGAPGSGIFDQNDGAVVVRTSGGPPAQLVVGGSGGGVPNSRYSYLGGTLEADTLRVENGSLFEQFNNRVVDADQVSVSGVYFFDSGSINTDAFDVNAGGAVTHRGSLTLADNGDPLDFEMRIVGGTHTYTLGSLTNHGDLAILTGGSFVQNGANTHTVDGNLVVGATGNYTMNGILLDAGYLETGTGSTFMLENGTVMTPSALLEGGDFHFDGGNLDCPLVEVDLGVLHFDADGTQDIDRLEFFPNSVNRLTVPAGRTVQLNGDLVLGLQGGLDIEASGSLTVDNLQVGPGSTVDAQGWGDLDLANELLVTGAGSNFEQRTGHTIGQALTVEADGSYRHRDGTTLFQGTLLGADAYLFAGGGQCTTGPLELRDGADMEIGSTNFQCGLLNDPAVVGAPPSLTQVGGSLTASAVNLGSTEVILEGGTFAVTGSAVFNGSSSFTNEADADFGSLTLGGSCQWNTVGGSTLDVTGSMQVAQDGETLNLGGGTIDVGFFAVRQTPSDPGVSDLSGNADLLIGSDFEVGEFGATTGTVWRQSSSSRTDVTDRTLIGVSGLLGPGQADRFLLFDNSALYSDDLLVGEQGNGTIEQNDTSSVILDDELRIGAIFGKGDYLMDGGSLSGATMTIGEVNAESRFRQTGGSAVFTGAVTNSGTFENPSGSFSALSFECTGDAHVSGTINAPVTNQGAMWIGDEDTAASLMVNGTFTTLPTKRLEIDITAPPGTGNNRDTITATGHAALAGRIDLKLPPALAAGVQIGDRWRILTAGSRSGSFATKITDAPGFPANRQLFLEYGPAYLDVVVRPVSLSFETWIKDWGLDPADWDPEDDPNGNGFPNIIDFALGISPATLGPSPIQYSFGPGGYFTMTFPKPDYLPEGITYAARFTTGLDGEWTAAEILENSDTTFTAQIRVPGPRPEKGFIQLVVEY